MFRAAVPVLYVGSSADAEEFYCRKLGFKLLSSWRPNETATDPCYMTIVRDGARMHVSSQFKDGLVGTWTSNVYVFVDDIDAVCEELTGNGVTFAGPLYQTWGMREIGVRDADLNIITFGQRILRATA